jgi:hypothetical protein
MRSEAHSLRCTKGMPIMLLINWCMSCMLLFTSHLTVRAGKELGEIRSAARQPVKACATVAS